MLTHPRSGNGAIVHGVQIVGLGGFVEDGAVPGAAVVYVSLPVRYEPVSHGLLDHASTGGRPDHTEG